MAPASPVNLSPTAWENRYLQGTTGWDLGQPAPALSQWVESQGPPENAASAIVLGAGRGYDALLFARHGFQVTAVDFAPSAIAALTQAAKAEQLSLTGLEQDIFTLLPQWQGQFDYVVEHTCFCALDPSLRPAYVHLVANLLAPQGELLAVFFTHDRPGVPPFGLSIPELTELFIPYFEVLSLDSVAVSVPARRGEEHFARLRRR